MGILNDLNTEELGIKKEELVTEKKEPLANSGKFSEIQTFKKEEPSEDKNKSSQMEVIDVFEAAKRVVEAEREAAEAKQKVAELERRLNSQQQQVQQQTQPQYQQPVQQQPQYQQPTQQQPQYQQPVTPDYLQSQNDVQDNIMLDIVQSTVDTFKGISGLASMLGKPATNKAKQLGYIAWSKKQDSECMARFRNGQIVSTGGFRFSVTPTEIMVLSYYGPDTILKIPSEIKGRLVTAISPNFLSCRNIRGAAQLIAGNSENADISSIKQCMACVKQIRLPKYITYLPTQLFEGCKSLEVVVIPEAVKAVSCFFLEGSSIKQLLLEGPCPSNFSHALEGRNVDILCTQQYRNTYQGIPRLKVLTK